MDAGVSQAARLCINALRRTRWQTRIQGFERSCDLDQRYAPRALAMTCKPPGICDDEARNSSSHQAATAALGQAGEW